MNANELVNAIKKGGKDGFFQDEIISILRQQQAEIEKLKSIVEDTIGQAFYEDDYHKAQAEIEALKKELALQRLSDIGQAIERELTDEEIKAVYGEYFDVKNFDWLQLQCIQAILKKASEK